MEPMAGAWSADEPTLDFTRLTASPAEPRERVGTRTPETRVRTPVSAAETAAWNPFAGSGAAASADVQSSVAALMSVPTVHAAEASIAVLPAQNEASVTMSSAVNRSSDPLSSAQLEPTAIVPQPTASSAPTSAAASPAPPVPARLTEDATSHTGREAVVAPALATTTLAPMVSAPAIDATALPLTVTRAVTGEAYTSSVTRYAADGSVTSVDLYGSARTFDHVRLDYRADGTLATRTMLDTETPGAMIVIDYDTSGARVARHEIDLPDRPYSRVDILFGAEGWAETRTRSGFASGDFASITVRYAAPGEIAQVEHLNIDGSRMIVGTAAANVLAAHGGDVLVGRGGADTFVLVEADAQALTVADFDRGEGDRLDLSPLLGSEEHFLGTAAFDGTAGAVRFDHVAGGALVSIDVDGDKVTDATIALDGVQHVKAGDFGF